LGASEFDKIKAKAEANEREAQLTLGCLSDIGQGVSRDHEQAFRWESRGKKRNWQKKTAADQIDSLLSLNWPFHTDEEASWSDF
jgi:TPR repeat protein